MTDDDTLTESETWDHVRAYDPQSERPTEALLRAVASATERDPLVGEPLYFVVDPDALDSLMRSDDDERDVSVAFSYLGCFVHVDREAVRVRQSAATGME